MNAKNSDACDGRKNQLEVFLGIVAMFIGAFFLLKYLIALITYIAFGASLEGAVVDGIVVMLLTFLLAANHKHFWLKVEGNDVQPAINIFDPQELRDGSTRFIVYGPGISFKFPWVLLEGKPIEIERQKVIDDCKPFKVTIGDTSLEINMKIAWKPHPHFLSSYLQNATKDGGQQEIQKIFVAKAKQMVEVWCSKMGDEVTEDKANYVRRNQSQLLRKPLKEGIEEIDADAHCLFTELYKFGEWIGFELVDISFASCDFDPDVQKRMNQLKESDKVLEIQNKIMEGSVPGDGMTRDKAAELAAVYCGIPGVKINRTIVEGLDLSALGGLGKEILKKIGGNGQ